MDDLTAVFIKIKDEDRKLISVKGAEDFEKEVHNVIEAAKGVIRASLVTTHQRSLVPQYYANHQLLAQPLSHKKQQLQVKKSTNHEISRWYSD